MSQRSLRERFGCRVFRDLVEGGEWEIIRFVKRGVLNFTFVRSIAERVSERESWVFYLLCLLDITVKW